MKKSLPFGLLAAAIVICLVITVLAVPDFTQMLLNKGMLLPPELYEGAKTGLKDFILSLNLGLL